MLNWSMEDRVGEERLMRPLYCMAWMEVTARMGVMGRAMTGMSNSVSVHECFSLSRILAEKDEASRD